MNDVPDDTSPRSVAISQLEALGLSTYAARTFTALTSLEGGTAQDVSEVADVPRTRVYDAAEELQDWGLVDVRQSTPRRFLAVSPETASRLFEQTYTDRVNRVAAALDDLDTASTSSEQRGVWTVTGRQAVTARTIELVEEATDEIIFMTIGELLGEELLDKLRTASDRGVAIWLAGMEPSLESELLAAVPDAELFDSMWLWEDTPAGRLLMVDGTKTLASVIVDDGDTTGNGREETAIWGLGENNNLVTLLRAMFTWQLDRADV